MNANDLTIEEARAAAIAAQDELDALVARDRDEDQAEIERLADWSLACWRRALGR